MATSTDALLVNALNRDHIRKGKKVAVVRGDMTTAIPTAITEGGVSGAPITLKELGAGWHGMGLLRKDDAVGMTRDQDTSTVQAIGFQDSVRTDRNQDTFTAQIVCLQTFRWSIESYLSVDLSGVTPDPNTGEINFPQPTIGDVPQARWMFLAQDGVGANRYWWGRLWTAGVVSETDDQSMGSDDDPWTWPMTISSETDVVAGYSIHHYFGGPGWKAKLASMGWS